MGLWDAFTDWIGSEFDKDRKIQLAWEKIPTFTNVTDLDSYFNGLDASIKTHYTVSAMYRDRRALITKNAPPSGEEYSGFIEGIVKSVMALPAPDSVAVDAMEVALNAWIKEMKVAGDMTPEQSKTKLSQITVKMLEIFGTSASIDYIAGLLPTMDVGNVSAVNTKYLIKSLGFGAVMAAVLHDPVKIGLLRAYNNALESSFRNRKLDHQDAFEAYVQRSFSESQIVDDPLIPVGGELREVDGKMVRFYDLGKLTDADMDAIENENDLNLDNLMAQHGFSKKTVGIIQDYATKSLTFGNLMQLARLGQYNRQVALFSLWGYGLDRRLMRSSLDTLQTAQDVGLWKGFRSMVEPGYVQGLIDADDVTQYWNKILVPQDVQDWAMSRLTKQREKFKEKEDKQNAALTRDLTKADWTTAFVKGNIDETAYRKKLAYIGYDSAEIDILVANAKDRIKTDTAKECKKLSLSDYELAYRNGIRTKDQVLARMAGEYCQADIDLESELLMIDDLSTEAPAKERDLTASTVTTAYVESVLTIDKSIAYLNKLGYDENEISTLMSLADIKKETYDAKKERDEALAEAKRVRDELKEARGGYKKLPLGDYEKAYKYGSMTMQEVLDRMVGEYSPADIEVERQLLTIGKA